jgi:hypothetical protein
MPFSILTGPITAKQGFVSATMPDFDSLPAADRRRPYRAGLHALAASLGAVTKRAFARRGLTGADVARQWPAIVGSELAAHCRPRQLRFAKPGEAIDGRLTLRVAPGWALEVQHLEPLLLERINGFFGYRAVGRIVLQQGPLPALRRPAGGRGQMPVEGAPAALDRALAAKLSTVTDPELRAALEDLGRALRAKQTRPARKP